MHIDTQEVVDKLEQAGVPAQQAKIHASVLAHALREQDAATLANCSTKLDLVQAIVPLAKKSDLAELSAELKQELSETKSELIHKFATDIDAATSRLRAQLIKWMFTVSVIQTSIISALLLKIVG